jgi:hypothetical protein
MRRTRRGHCARSCSGRESLERLPGHQMGRPLGSELLACVAHDGDGPGKGDAIIAGQDRPYDIVTFNGGLAAENAGNKKLATLYEHRFRPEYAVAFLAWQKLDPLKNVSAPAGSVFMGEYTNATDRESKKLVEEAKRYFEKAVKARETGDHYVKVSVFLVTVLLLTALGQRFEMSGRRILVLVVAFTLLIISTFWIVTFPRT